MERNTRSAGVAVRRRSGRLFVVPSQRILGGRYRLAEMLGVGGMSVVWRANDEVLGRAVAVKILAGDYATDPHSRAAVLSEAQAVARLSHPNICNVFDYGESLEEDGQTVPYVVMELLAGPSLATQLEAGPLPPPTGLRVLAEVAAGLAAAHAHNVVHRDVKPGNVILTTTGAKVFDFGIAAHAGEPDDADQGGRILGTPSCVAPERLRGGIVLPASDMYGWGVLLYRVLTGKLPWPTWIPLHERTSATATALPDIDGVPVEVGELILSCLAEDPADRPSAGTAAAVLQLPVSSRPARPSIVAMPIPVGSGPNDPTASINRYGETAAETRLRRRRLLAAATALGIAAVALAIVLNSALGNGPPGDPAAAAEPNSATPGAIIPGTLPSPGQTPTEGSGPLFEPDGGGEVMLPDPPGTVTLTVTVGPSPSPSEQSGSFTSPGGRVAAVCRPLGAFPTAVVAAPGYISLGPLYNFTGGFLVYFSKPAVPDVSPRMTYKIAVECRDGEPEARMTVVTGEEGLPSSTGP